MMQPGRKLISSKDNPTFRELLALGTARGIEENRRFVLMGEKVITDYLRNPALQQRYKLAYEVLTEGHVPATVGSQIFLPEALFKLADTLGTHHNLLVLEYQPPQTFELAKFSGRALALPLGDPNNLGACLRSALAFAMNQIILAPGCSHPFLPKSVKASSGAALQMDFLRLSSWKNLVSYPKVMALDTSGDSLQTVHWPKDFILVVGEEGRGLPPEFREPGSQFQKISIPILKVESLNAAVAASIALYQLAQNDVP